MAVDEHLMIVSDTLLNMTSSEDQIAFVFAHEASHVTLNHHMADSASQKFLELEADRSAVEQLRKNGYDPLQAHNLLLALHRHYPTSAHYPSIPERLAALYSNHQPSIQPVRRDLQYSNLRKWLDLIIVH